MNELKARDELADLRKGICERYTKFLESGRTPSKEVNIVEQSRDIRSIATDSIVVNAKENVLLTFNRSIFIKVEDAIKITSDMSQYVSRRCRTFNVAYRNIVQEYHNILGGKFLINFKIAIKENCLYINKKYIGKIEDLTSFNYNYLGCIVFKKKGQIKFLTFNIAKSKLESDVSLINFCTMN